MLATATFVLCCMHITEPTITMVPHTVIGTILGVLLVVRVYVGVSKAAEVMGLITSYNKSLRTIAVFSTYVNETLTVAAGAELEKKAVANFRYELDRLLNLSNFCFTLMLKGLKMEEPPEALRPQEGAALEAKVLSSVGSPSLMICKWMANLFDQQILASRVSAEQVSAVQTEIGSIMDTYHKTRAMQLAPMPASLSSFTYFFVFLWVHRHPRHRCRRAPPQRPRVQPRGHRRHLRHDLCPRPLLLWTLRGRQADGEPSQGDGRPDPARDALVRALRRHHQPHRRPRPVRARLPLARVRRRRPARPRLPRSRGVVRPAHLHIHVRTYIHTPACAHARTASARIDTSPRRMRVSEWWLQHETRESPVSRTNYLSGRRAARAPFG